jgi:hypothetical protein
LNTKLEDRIGLDYPKVTKNFHDQIGGLKEEFDEVVKKELEEKSETEKK